MYMATQSSMMQQCDMAVLGPGYNIYDFREDLNSNDEQVIIIDHFAKPKTAWKLG